MQFNWWYGKFCDTRKFPEGGDEKFEKVEERRGNSNNTGHLHRLYAVRMWIGQGRKSVWRIELYA